MFMVQFFEWFSTIFMIRYFLKYHLDLNAPLENSFISTSSRLKKEHVDFRKAEMKLGKVFAVLYAFLIVVQMLITIIIFLDANTSTTRLTIYGLIQVVFTVILSWAAIDLYRLMNQYFPENFKRTKDHFISFNVLYLLLHMLYIIEIGFLLKNDTAIQRYNDDTDENHSLIEQTLDMCLNQKLIEFLSAVNYFITNVFQIHNLISVIIVVYLKSIKNMVEGIADLELLMKVSFFQVYKDPEIQLMKDEIESWFDNEERSSAFFKSFHSEKHSLNSKDNTSILYNN